MDKQYNNIPETPEQELPAAGTGIAPENNPFEPIQKAPGMTVVFLDEEQPQHGTPHQAANPK